MTEKQEKVARLMWRWVQHLRANQKRRVLTDIMMEQHCSYAYELFKELLRRRPPLYHDTGVFVGHNGDNYWVVLSPTRMSGTEEEFLAVVEELLKNREYDPNTDRNRPRHA